MEDIYAIEMVGVSSWFPAPDGGMVVVAKDFIDPDILAGEGIYPPPEVAARLQWIEEICDALGLYDRVWTEFKAAIGQ